MMPDPAQALQIRALRQQAYSKAHLQIAVQDLHGVQELQS